MNNPKAIVVGAGPVGLFAALALVDRGLKVRIIDEAWRPGSHSYALALHPASLRLLQRRGLPEKLLRSIRKVDRLGIYDERERRATIDFTTLDTDFNFVGVLPQSTLEEALEAALQSHGVNVEWNHRLTRIKETDESVEVGVERLVQGSSRLAEQASTVARRRNCETSFVVGADGHSSTVRRALDIDYENAGPARYFAVFEFDSNFDIHNELRVVLARDSTNVLWPLAGRRFRWCFELTDLAAPPATRKKDRSLVQHIALPELSIEALQELIRTRAPWFSSVIERMEWSTIVRFEQKLATRLGKGRSWLIGDAAHMALPFAVQSMNVGFAEGDELAKLISDASRFELRNPAFAAFESRTLNNWRRLLRLEGDRMSYESTVPQWIRANADRIESCIPASGTNRRVLLRQLGFHPLGATPSGVGSLV